MKTLHAPCLALSAVLLAGCTTPQVLYDSAQREERTKCNSLPNPADYSRCVQQNSLDYSRYEQARRKAATP